MIGNEAFLKRAAWLGYLASGCVRVVNCLQIAMRGAFTGRASHNARSRC